MASVTPAQLVFPSNAAPLVIESLEYFPAGSNQPVHLDLSIRADAPLVLPAGSRQIQASCALLDFGDTEKIYYRFRLSERGTEWRDNGSDNMISFYELPAGQHTLSVQAVNSGGVASRITQLTFTVEEYYWRRTGFWIFCSGLLVALTGALTWRIGSQRVRAARKLAALQTRLASVLEHTTDFVGFADAHGKMFYLNQAGRKLIGLDPAASLNDLTLQTLYPKWAAQQQTELWQPASAEQSVWSGESALRHRDGREIPVSQVIIAHRHRDGTLDFSSTISRDISATKQNERIREALRRFASALTATLRPVELGRTVARECQNIFQHHAFFFVVVDAAGKILRGGYREDTKTGASQPTPITDSITTAGPALREVLAGQNLFINRPPDGLLTDDRTERFGETDRASASAMFVPHAIHGYIQIQGSDVGHIGIIP